LIVVFGTVCLDRIRHVPHLPAPGAYVEIESEAVLLGGEAANTASHLRRWGAETTLAGNALASDADGLRLAEFLAQKDLYYEVHAVPCESSPSCDIYVTPDGERTMFGLGFSTMVAPGIETFIPQPGGIFTTDANLGEVAETYAERAREAGMQVYLMDLPPTSRALHPAGIWQSSTRWYGERGNPEVNLNFVQEVANRTGCTAILTDSGNGFVVGMPGNPSVAEPKPAPDTKSLSAAKGIGVADPAAGKLSASEIGKSANRGIGWSDSSSQESASRGRTTQTYPPFPRIKTLDSTGAGDTFRAGMLFGLNQGWPQARCLAFAAAAASLAAGYIGAAEGPTREQVETHIANHPEIAEQYV
jgi:pfkB family carbohydrate kinase